MVCGKTRLAMIGQSEVGYAIRQTHERLQGMFYIEGGTAFTDC